MATRVETLDKAVDSFEAHAKRHLDKPGWTKAWNQKFLAELAKSVTAMKQQLTACDRNEAAFTKEPKDAAHEKNLEAQLAYFDESARAFEKSAGIAIAHLNAKIVEQKKARDKDAAMPDAMAAEVVKGLKVLKTTLDAIAKSNDTWVANSQVAIDRLGKQISLEQAIARNFMSSLSGAVARGLAAAQRIKATPTPAVYNHEMLKAARDITQVIGNVDKLTAKGLAVPAPANHRALFQALSPFGNGNLQTVDVAATPATVLANTTQFNKLVKDVKTAFNA